MNKTPCLSSGKSCPLSEHIPPIARTGRRSKTSSSEKETFAQASEIPLGLSPTQQRIYELLGKEYTIKEIAAQLSSSPSTIKTHVRRMMAHIPNIQSLRQLQHQAIRQDERIRLRQLSSF